MINCFNLYNSCSLSSVLVWLLPNEPVPSRLTSSLTVRYWFSGVLSNSLTLERELCANSSSSTDRVYKYVFGIFVSFFFRFMLQRFFVLFTN